MNKNGEQTVTGKGITKEDVIAELRHLQNIGHSMRSTDFDNWLKYEIKKHFGGYKNAKQELLLNVLNGYMFKKNGLCYSFYYRKQLVI